MTPQEEAINLYSKFLPYIDARFEIFSAKQCALIAVDEIIEECGNWTGGTNDGWDTKRFDYWQEVKHEIEKL